MKKILIAIILAILIVPVFGTVVYGADDNSSKSEYNLEKDLQRIEKFVLQRIDAAINDEHSIYVKLQSDLANANNDEEILILNNEYTEELDRIIDQLLYTTEKKVDQLIAKYEKHNISVEKYWISVTIGGRDILVDPCRVRPN